MVWERQLKLVEEVQNNDCKSSVRELLFYYEPLFKKLTYDSLLRIEKVPIEKDDVINLLK